MMKFPDDFKEFLNLLNEHRVKYLLVGGYVVSYYGYPRPTGDMDVWIRVDADNARRTADVLREFGFDADGLQEILTREFQIIRMGVPPFRIEVSTYIDGVDFDECYEAREIADFDGVQVNLLSLFHLKANKLASGRHKDLNDLEHLP